MTRKTDIVVLSCPPPPGPGRRGRVLAGIAGGIACLSSPFAVHSGLACLWSAIGLDHQRPVVGKSMSVFRSWPGGPAGAGPCAIGLSYLGRPTSSKDKFGKNGGRAWSRHQAEHAAARRSPFVAKWGRAWHLPSGRFFGPFACRSCLWWRGNYSKCRIGRFQIAISPSALVWGRALLLFGD